MPENRISNNNFEGFEIVKNDLYYVVRNLKHPNQLEIDDLEREWSNGVPYNWIPYWAKFQQDQSEITNKISFYRDEHRKYLAKKKLGFYKTNHLLLDRASERADDSSIVKEMRIASEINQIFSDSFVLDLIQKNGFEQIKFIEPLLGVISRTAHTKYTVYPMVVGDSYYHTRLGSFNRTQSIAVEQLCDELKIILARNNIVGDFGNHQVITTHENDIVPNCLYVFDAEGLNYKYNKDDSEE